MKKIPITDEQTIKNIWEVATKITGIRKEHLNSKTRNQNIHLARMVVSNISLIEKGIHYTTISEVLNRDRSSIYHYEKQHHNLYSNWDTYRRLFNKVYNAYTDEKKTQLQKVDLIILASLLNKIKTYLGLNKFMTLRKLKRRKYIKN